MGTLCLFDVPVIASDGCSYERDSITPLAASGRPSPATQEVLRRELYVAQALKDRVHRFKLQLTADLLAFATEAIEQQTLVDTALGRAKTYISSLPSESQPEFAKSYVDLCHRINRPVPANLVLHVDPASKIPVFLHRADGKAALVKVESSAGAPIRDLISTAFSKLTSMTINFMGRRLDQSKSLADYQLEGDNVLTLVATPQSCAGAPQTGSTQGPASAEKARVYGERGTLYSRCGGIFGVSAFVDRCMDSWMANPVLNANEAVGTWHGKAQRCGLKFLVTQLMGNLTGGPQVYTGRDMASSHKHLNIDEAQWGSFMDDLDETCLEFGLPTDDVRDLRAIITSLMDDCVVSEGELVPNHPVKSNPPGDSLYARIGGVYPLALFADRLVDAMLSDSRVRVPVDGVKRAEPSLKYLFTELCCHIAGGPESMTSMRDPETYLKLSSNELFYLLGCAKRAADHIRDRTLQNDLVKALYDNSSLILDPARVTLYTDRLAFNCPKSGVQTHADMQQSLTRAAEAMGVPVRWLYVPGGLAYLDDGMTEQQSRMRQKISEDHGFRPVAMSAVKSADAAAAGAGNRGV